MNEVKILIVEDELLIAKGLVLSITSNVGRYSRF